MSNILLSTPRIKGLISEYCALVDRSEWSVWVLCVLASVVYLYLLLLRLSHRSILQHYVVGCSLPTCIWTQYILNSLSPGPGFHWRRAGVLDGRSNDAPVVDRASIYSSPSQTVGCTMGRGRRAMPRWAPVTSGNMLVFVVYLIHFRSFLYM